MGKFRYNGTEERVFPTLGITVSPNEEFDAPDGFIAADVTAATSGKPSKTKFNPDAKDGDKDGFVQDATVHERPVTQPSAPSDTTEGE